MVPSRHALGDVDGGDRAGLYRDVVVESRAVRELWPDGREQAVGNSAHIARKQPEQYDTAAPQEEPIANMRTSGLKPEPKKRPKPLYAYVLGRVAAHLAANGRPGNQAELEERISALIESKGYEAGLTTVRDYAREMLCGYDEEMVGSSKTDLNRKNRLTQP